VGASRELAHTGESLTRAGEALADGVSSHGGSMLRKS
jgi:hypothetical protein